MGLPEQADATARRGRKDWHLRHYYGTARWFAWGNGRRSYHSYLKHYSRRLFRRWAKQDPENAPRKNRYNGWET